MKLCNIITTIVVMVTLLLMLCGCDQSTNSKTTVEARRIADTQSYDCGPYMRVCSGM